MIALPDVELSIYQAILARRSVRRYTPENVDKSSINILLEAAVRAPTAMHQEPWAFVIIQDKQLLQNISERAKPAIISEAQSDDAKRKLHMHHIFEQPNFNIFYDAGTLILICGKTSVTFATADCWLAAENMMLAACAMGLGTCVIGCSLLDLNTSEAKAELNIPAEFSVVAPVIVGYPVERSAPTPRNAPLILSYIPAGYH